VTQRAKNKRRKKRAPPMSGAPSARRKAPRASALKGLPPVDPTPLRWSWLTALIIVITVVVAYWNTLGNEFVSFDDRKYIYQNELVVGDGGLGAIWHNPLDEKAKLHYYPLTFTTFWIEHALVGLEPPDVEPDAVMGKAAHPLYHVTQMLLHAINACLVLFVLRALGVRFATAVFTALFFALHPVNTASIAWMAERKNLVSALFFWSSLLLYLNHRRLAERSRPYARRKLPWLYVAAVLAFALALTAKAAALVLAPIIVITDRLLDRRWSWESVWRASPFFLLGMIAARITAMHEALIAKSWEPVAMWARPLIALAALVHYVTKMLVPVRQALIYPRWEVSLSNPRYWIAVVVTGAAAALIWLHRKWLGDQWLWGLGLFLLTIAPVLGLKHYIGMQFAFVSDHYMYYGSPGVILMIALLLERWCRSTAEAAAPDPLPGWRRNRLIAVATLSLVALVGCGWRVVQQNRTWHDNQTLWAHTIEISPDAAIARMNLGNHYRRHGQHELALEQYKEFARIWPDYVRAWRSSAQAARRLDRPDEAMEFYRTAIDLADAKNPRSHSIRKEYADYLRSQGRRTEALAEYEILLQRSPPNVEEIRRIVKQLEYQP
jgi:hypothetical protein